MTFLPEKRRSCQFADFFRKISIMTIENLINSVDREENRYNEEMEKDSKTVFKCADGNCYGAVMYAGNYSGGECGRRSRGGYSGTCVRRDG